MTDANISPSCDGHISRGVKSSTEYGTPGKSCLSESKEFPPDPTPLLPNPAIWFTTASTNIL